MKNILVTGGTTFVSRYTAEYFVRKGYEVYVLNRGTKLQSDGVKLIKADRRNLNDALKSYHFDAVLDITAYSADDIDCLLNGLGSFDNYVMISSSAVYPETTALPFSETAKLGVNNYWGAYGTNKIAAETVLLERVNDAYILRPPYLYGQMNNVYREAFIFDCALQNRKFCLPKNGEMKLQFFHVDDLCRIIELIIDTKPQQHIYNVGNGDLISIRDWVTLCYAVLDKTPEFVSVNADVEQRKYFPFYDYEYYLDVSRQKLLLDSTKPMFEGLSESFEWYINNTDKVNKKPLLEFIDENLDVNTVR